MKEINKQVKIRKRFLWLQNPSSLWWFSTGQFLNYFFPSVLVPLNFRREGSVIAIPEQHERHITHESFVLLGASGHYQRQDFCPDRRSAACSSWVCDVTHADAAGARRLVRPAPCTLCLCLPSLLWENHLWLPKCAQGAFLSQCPLLSERLVFMEGQGGESQPLPRSKRGYSCVARGSVPACMGVQKGRTWKSELQARSKRKNVTGVVAAACLF